MYTHPPRNDDDEQLLVVITVRQQQTINQVHRHLRQQTILLQTITIPIRETRVQYRLHLLQASQRCRKICVL